jgi:AbiV family abortive infection protein
VTNSDLPPIDRAMLATLAAGARSTFANAEALYNEARLLYRAGALARSLMLHQISLEECSKVNTIGAWATSLIMGHAVDQERVLRAMRLHKAKNNANAYSLTVSDAEREARDMKDWPAAIEAFRKTQEAFHEESNLAKNAALYTDFRDGAFVGPAEMITEDMHTQIVARNEQFLSGAFHQVKTLDSMELDPESRQRFAIAFADEANRLKDPNAAPELLDNIAERFFKGQEIVQAATDALSQLDVVSRKPYQRRDLCEVIDGVAARMEEFLRTAVFPTSSRRDSTALLVSNLPALGLDAQSVSDLEALRKLYNQSKHDPAVQLRLADVRTIITGAHNAFLALGSPHGGETEVAICLPSAHWTHIATVDNFHLDWKSWDALKPALSSHPNFKWGPEHFAPEAWSSLASEGDFLDAGVWDGDYGTLLRIIARHHDDAKMRAVLPGLQRGQNSVSVGAAIVTAAIDIARASGDVLDASQIARQVSSRAAAEYAMTIDISHPVVIQVADFIAAQPFVDWARLSGPLIVDLHSISGLQVIPGPQPMARDGDRIVLGFSSS